MNYWAIAGLKKASYFSYVGCRALNIDYNRVMGVVQMRSALSEKRIKSKDRSREVIYARAVFVAIMRDYADKSLQNIGNVLGRNHSTILNAYRRKGEYLDYHPEYRTLYLKCLSDLGLENKTKWTLKH